MIIDAHLHLYQSKKHGEKAKGDYHIWEYGPKKDVKFSELSGDIEDALNTIDEASAEKAVIVNLCHREAVKAMNFEGIGDDLAAKLKASNEWVCQIAEDYRELEAFVGIDPSILSSSEMVTHVNDMVKDFGARGVKVHPVHQKFLMHDNRLLDVWGKCQDLGVSVIAHCGPAREGVQYGSPESFIPTLESFPELKVVICHMGGGMWRELPGLAGRFFNAFFDLSEIIEWVGAPLAPSSRELAELIMVMNPEKVIMGSDFPWYDIKTSVDKIRNLPLLNNDQKENILGKNAKRIFSL